MEVQAQVHVVREAFEHISNIPSHFGASRTGLPLA